MLRADAKPVRPVIWDWATPVPSAFARPMQKLPVLQPPLRYQKMDWEFAAIAPLTWSSPEMKFSCLLVPSLFARPIAVWLVVFAQYTYPPAAASPP